MSDDYRDFGFELQISRQRILQKSWMYAVVGNLKFKLADKDGTKEKYVEL